MRNKDKLSSISRGITKFCDQIKVNTNIFKWKIKKYLLSLMITAQSSLLSDLVENDPYYQNSFFNDQKTLLKNHQIEKHSNHLLYPIDDLFNCFLKKTSEKLMTNSKNPKTIFENSDDKTVDEILKNLVFISNDGTDLAKPYARKMPGRERIRDGSASSSNRCVVNSGYHIEGSVAIKNDKIFPFLMNLYSGKEEKKYQNHDFAEKENIGILEKYKLLKNSIYLYDRAADDEKKLLNLKNKTPNFVVRAKIKRNVSTPEKLSLIKEAKTAKEHDKYFEPLSKIIPEMEFQKHPDFGDKEAAFKKVLISRTFYNKGTYRQKYFSVTLVIIRFPKGEFLDEDEADGKDSMIMLYTSIPIQTVKEAFCIFEIYKKRWFIEIYFRFLKQTFLIEKVQVLNYLKIKNLLKYVVMASSYHYRKFAQLMEKNKKNVSSQKKRRTFAEIERAQIQVGYCAYLKFKGYKPNVSNFASFIKELFRLKIRHEIFTGAP